MMKEKFVKLDEWVKKILVDPLSKDPVFLDEKNNTLTSVYGRKYPIVDKIYDLRLLNNITTNDQRIWKNGQYEYEKWSSNVVSQDFNIDYLAEIEGVKDVYTDISVDGACLDVGGSQGRLRMFLEPDQPYLSCDPFLNCFDNLNRQPNLLKAYPFLLEPVNFVCCDAEFLPIKTGSFNTVHMRSVIDHFLSPELALNEAYRVLCNDGKLIVGLYVQGGKNGQFGFHDSIKKIIKHTLEKVGINRFKDYHVWHPTYNELTELIKSCGFKTEKVHWQKGYNDTVCYIQARKCLGLTRQQTNPLV